MTYEPKKIEKKWQAAWQRQKIYNAKNSGRKKYVLIEFPYPSGEGLHMGHLRPYVAGDVYSRYQRAKGHEVMYPMGWDAFGLPAENFAIKKGVHPSITTKSNIKNAKRQVQSWGIGFDWSREINTTDPQYYKWTQWIFLQFYKAGLAYEATGLINWCPKDKTGLANEEVIDGACERCGTMVEKKELRQWYLKITAYAEKLLEGLKNLPDWPEQVKLQQENWIGKSEGAEIEFPLSVIPASESPVSTAEVGESRKALVIHGLSGNSRENWFPWLKNSLKKKNWQVTVPDLPGAGHAKVSEWNETLTNLAGDFDQNSVIVGHSIGVPAAFNFVQTLNKKIDKLILVGPVNPNQNWRQLKSDYPNLDWEAVRKFVDIKIDWKKITSLAREIIFYYSDDDKYIPAESVDYYKKILPNAAFRFLPGKGHFNKSSGVTEFPEILEDITPVYPPASRGIKIFTTRPDTIFGATYMVLAPENPLVRNFKAQISNVKGVEEYIEAAKKKTDIQRSALDKEKTGVELKGINAINPATGEKISVWIADYVLMGYGTGAIMAVPQHDERDRQFAEKYKLPIVDKPLIPIPEAIKKFGKSKVQYKLRDWVFSRQRYWGEPIPIIHCPTCGIVPVPDQDLPVKLPNVKKYEPTGTGESPLAVIDKWVNVKCPSCGGKAKRETNTMPQWAGSSWYYIRYTDQKNKKELAKKDLMKHWLPVDVYFGGMEHTTLHLLYSRFWNLFLHDQGIVPVPEPYTKRVPHGIILAEDGEKMSKSRGNVVNPDEIVELYGADTMRMYELFLGPHEQMVKWNDKGIIGVRRFLEKVWRLSSSVILRYSEGSRDSSSDRSRTQNDNLIHKTIKKVTEDIENFRFNTAVSSLMILANELENSEAGKAELEVLLKLLSPFAPHVAEELWQTLGHKKSILLEPWPEYDVELIKDETVKIAVQINGKVRGTIEIAAAAPQSEVEELAKQDSNIQKYLQQGIRKVIFVPGKIINFVV